MKKFITIIGCGVAVFWLQACAVQGTQKFTPTGIRVTNSVGLGTEAFGNSDLNEPSRVIYNNTNNYYDAPEVVQYQEPYCPDITIVPVGWY